jgi:hypothetical protein
MTTKDNFLSLESVPQKDEDRYAVIELHVPDTGFDRFSLHRIRCYVGGKELLIRGYEIAHGIDEGHRNGNITLQLTGRSIKIVPLPEKEDKP